MDVSLEFLERHQFVTRGYMPQFHRVIEAPRGERAPIGRKHDRHDALAVTAQDGLFATRGDFPQPHCSVEAGGREQFAIGGEGRANNPILMAFERGK